MARAARLGALAVPPSIAAARGALAVTGSHEARAHKLPVPVAGITAAR